MVKYVRFGKMPMFAISMFRTSLKNWKVEVSPCDEYGRVVSDPVAWDIFPSWWEAFRYVGKQNREFTRYVNDSK